VTAAIPASAEKGDAAVKPITDRAEVSIDFPDKAYMGAFGRDSGFEVRADEAGVTLKLVRSGEEKRDVEFHLHYYLLADIVREMAASLTALPPIDDAHGEPLLRAAQKLVGALERPRVATAKSPRRRSSRPGGAASAIE
jgi:hypothetical protein